MTGYGAAMAASVMLASWVRWLRGDVGGEVVRWDLRGGVMKGGVL
jgi:hypothetical protein